MPWRSLCHWATSSVHHQCVLAHCFASHHAKSGEDSKFHFPGKHLSPKLPASPLRYFPPDPVVDYGPSRHNLRCFPTIAGRSLIRTIAHGPSVLTHLPQFAGTTSITQGLRRGIPFHHRIRLFSLNRCIFPFFRHFQFMCCCFSYIIPLGSL